jgi:hypothetical protein
MFYVCIIICSRKEEQHAALEAKEAMKNIKPEDMFSTGPDASLYSKYDDDGIPTHTTDGEPLSKSQCKKLKKDWDKQKKLYEQVHIHTCNTQCITVHGLTFSLRCSGRTAKV